MKAKQLSINLLIALISMLFAIALIEGGVRLIFGVQPQPGRFSVDPHLGWAWTPNYNQVETYKRGSEFRMMVNSQGYRNDNEYEIPKPNNTFRIIALGDSIVASPGVELEETFVKQLEQLIQADYSDRQIEVMNAGVDDYSTEQELIWLQKKGLIYEPDLLIVHVYLNDSRSFVRPSPEQAAISNFMASHSAAFTFFRDNVFAQKAKESAGQEEFRFRFKPLLVDNAWRKDPRALTELIQSADRDWGLAWYEHELQHIETQLLEINHIAEDKGIPLLFVVFPVSIQIFAESETPLDLHSPQYELTQFAEKEEIPLLDLLPKLAATDLSDIDLYYDWAHLKPAGHNPIAQAIKQALDQYRLLPK